MNSAHLFYGNSNSCNFIGSAELNDLVPWILIINGGFGVLHLGLDLSLCLLLNSLLSLLSGILFIVLNRWVDSYNFSLGALKLIKINSGWAVEGVNAWSDWEVLVGGVKISELFVSNCVESDEPLLFWDFYGLPFNKY